MNKTISYTFQLSLKHNKQPQNLETENNNLLYLMILGVGWIVFLLFTLWCCFWLGVSRFKLSWDS